MEKMDAIVLPIALTILLLVLRSITVMVIPICSVAIATCTSFAIMYPIALVWGIAHTSYISKMSDVASFALSIMMAVIIAMSIDYSLFRLVFVLPIHDFPSFE